MTIMFTKAEKRINDNIVFPAFDLSVTNGEIVAICTTVNIRYQIISLLLGKSTLSQGDIKIDKLTDKKTDVGFLFLEHGLYERLTVREMLSFTKRLYDSTVSIDFALGKLQLQTKKQEKISRLSYSEQKRVQFACLLIQDPSIYILEEPEQNLDLVSRRIYLSLLAFLRDENKTILMITGNLEGVITAADRVYRLDDRGLIAVQVTTENSGDIVGFNEDLEYTGDAHPISFDKIPSKVQDKIVLFHPLEIDFIESIDGQTYLYVKGETFPCAFTLQKLEQRLLAFGFFRCHRSYIVNLQKVREVITWTRNSYSIILENTQKSTIPLSKTKMTQLKEMIGL